VYVAPPPPPPVVFTGFKLWPNPFSNQLFIQSGTALNKVDATIYDIVGQIVWKGTLDVPAQVIVSLDLPTFTPGMYILQLRGVNFVDTRKLLKQ